MKKYLLGCFLFVLSSVVHSQTTVTTISGATGNFSTSTTIALSTWRNPMRLIYDADSNLIAVSRNNQAIMKIDLENDQVSIIAGSGINGVTGDTPHADPLQARFNGPYGIALDAAGNIYVADRNNHKIRKIEKTTTGYGAVTTFAGTGTDASADNDDPLQASFSHPIDIAINVAGDIFVAEAAGTGTTGNATNNKIRKIAKADGKVTTLVSANVTNLFGLAIDTDDNLIFVDIDEVSKVNVSTGVVTVIAGLAGTTGNITGTTLANARFNGLLGVAVHKATGDIYVTQGPSSSSVNNICKIDRNNDLVSVIAGGNNTGGSAGALNTPIAANDAKFAIPTGISVNVSANVFYIGDTNNSKIRKIMGGVLPVKLTSFTATMQNNAVKLNWATASESNNSHFDILRSADGNNAAVIGTVSGNGSSDDVKTYNYLDYAPLSGDNYYQLRQVDYDGRSELSEIAVVSTDLTKQTELNVHAALNNDEVKLAVYSAKGGKSNLKITDVNGNSVLTKKVVLEKGYSELRLSLPLQKKVYIAALNIGSENISAKFIPND